MTNTRAAWGRGAAIGAVSVLLAATCPMRAGAEAPPPAERASQTRPAGLNIVVIAGEDAVNIIQQKTAVAPIVEVRDRNDQPVAGAVVQFAIRGGRATFGGARMLTVATNAAGRAVATGLTPTASGALQISASAAFQGQTAVVAIAQTNVLTAAEAAAIGAGGASGGSGAAAGGAGAGGGGGLSGTAIGAIAGGIGAGVFAATQAGKGDTASGPATGTASSSTPAPTPTPGPTLWDFAASPGLNAISQCPTYVGNGVGPNTFNASVNPDGSFSTLISILTPAATLTGRITPTDVTGTFSCVGGGGPVGTMNAVGSAPSYQGSWSWGGLSGAITVRRAQ